MRYEICGPSNGVHEDSSLVGCDAVYTNRVLDVSEKRRTASGQSIPKNAIFPHELRCDTEHLSCRIVFLFAFRYLFLCPVC
jgi:hypothetical protein